MQDSRGPSLVIRDVKLLCDDGCSRLVNILIKDGLIKKISHTYIDASYDEVIDGDGLLALPGLIDCHTHIRFPWRNEAEDIESGTSAAAAGGVTTLLEMPSTIPPAVVPSALKLREEALQSATLYSNVGLYAGAGTENLNHMERLAKMGVVAFKTYTYDDRRVPNPHEGMTCTDLYSLYRTMMQSASLGLPLVVHAEEDSLIKGLLSEKAVKTPEEYVENRPPLAEVAAINNVGLIAKHTNATVCIAHVSSGEAVNCIQFYKKKYGVKMYGELRPDYLIFDINDLIKWGGLLKTKPPLRSKRDQIAIIDAIKRGVISYVGSDHAPSTLHEKMDKEINSCPAGIASIEFSLLNLLELAHQGKIHLFNIVKFVRNASKLFGLWPNRGAIKEGANADLVLVCLNSRNKVQIDNLYTKSRETLVPYESKVFHSRVCYTIVNGALVYDKGHLVKKSRAGSILKRQGTSY
jgi:dihydroorotase (multifunctional complex type)